MFKEREASLDQVLDNYFSKNLIKKFDKINLFDERNILNYPWQLSDHLLPKFNELVITINIKFIRQSGRFMEQKARIDDQSWIASR